MPLSPNPLDDQNRRIVELVAGGQAASRSELAKILDVAVSTVSLRVQALIDADVLREDGHGNSSGGRRPRRLRVNVAEARILAAELGGGHARIGLLDLTGKLHASETIPINIAAGPEETLKKVAAGCRALAGDTEIRAIGMALPGPVRLQTGSVDQPSRMPGWQGYRVRERLTELLGVPAVVDNDANLMALGEHHRRLSPAEDSITVKAGTAIGSGIIVQGAIHRGATAAAGDITHTQIDPTLNEPCSCGNRGCLETVASGASLVRQMGELGQSVPDAAAVLALARDGDPTATTLIRTAGTHLGQALSGVVNFFNPHAVFLTGSLSASEPFIAAVRSRVYEACHPLATQTLLIEAAASGQDAALYGAARIALGAVDLTA